MKKVMEWLDKETALTIATFVILDVLVKVAIVYVALHIF